MNENRSTNSRLPIAATAKRSVAVAACACGVALVLALLAGGCAAPRPEKSASKVERPVAVGVSQDELGEALANYEEFFVSTIKHVSNELDDLMPEKDSYRKILEFRENAIESSRAMLEQEDQLDALIDSWVLTIRLSQYLKSGPGGDLFGEHQPLVVEKLETIRAYMERTAGTVLTKGTFVKVRKTAYQFSGEHPIGPDYTNIMVFATEGVGDKPSPFMDIAEITLTPFRAIEGVGQTALGTGRLSDAAYRFSDVVEEIPESARWQLLLLLYDMEQLTTVESMKDSFHELATAGTKLADSTATMPEDIRKQMSIMFDEIDDKQENLHTTMDKARQTAGAFDETARSVTAAAGIWEAAAKATSDTLAMMKSKKKPGLEKPKPSQLEQFQATAHATAKAADEVKSAANEIRQLAESEKAADVLKETLIHASSLVDRVSIRLAQLLGLAFVLTAVYKLTIPRLCAKRTKPAPS